MSQSPAQQWNDRYGAPEWAYGTSPNVYFAEKLAHLAPGRILLPAEGEGRNAVHAAVQGWDVEAFDISIEGQRKAERLAMEQGVRIRYQVAGVAEVAYAPESLDAIGFSYAHFPLALRRAHIPRLLASLRPGGHVILECFGKQQISYQPHQASGGPRDTDLLYSIEEVREFFPGVETLELLEGEVRLSEGLYHNGLGWVVRFFGRKG